MASHHQNEFQQLHFLLIPLMSQSHIIPLTDFAKLLAHRGLIVSVVTTPRNAARYQPIIDRARLTNLDIRLISLQFPGNDVGLPQDCENMDALTSPNLAKPFFDACELLEEPLEKLIGELEPRPSCIISTNALPWTQLLAEKFNIPRYVFQTVSCFTVQCSKKLTSNVSSPDSDSFHVPDIPDKIMFNKFELPDMRVKSPDDITTIIDYIKRVESLARGIISNTFEELEPWYVDEYKKSTKKVWSVGPVSLCNKQVEDKIDRGNKITIDGHLCLKWLDSMPQKSVIYACFGSLCHISYAQLQEIGLGLERSGHRYIWIIRELDYTPELEKWIKDENFEERVKPFGLVIRGWAPQVLILSHPAIAGFLSHCGWNSTLEGLCAGIPIITWPMFAEQFYNEKFVVDVLRVGVRVGAKGVMKFGEEGKVLVKKENIREAIHKLMDMDMDEEGKQRKERAKMIGEMAKNATEEGGSSYLNISSLIEDVKLCIH